MSKIITLYEALFIHSFWLAVTEMYHHCSKPNLYVEKSFNGWNSDRKRMHHQPCAGSRWLSLNINKWVQNKRWRLWIRMVALIDNSRCNITFLLTSPYWKRNAYMKQNIHTSLHYLCVQRLDSTANINNEWNINLNPYFGFPQLNEHKI